MARVLNFSIGDVIVGLPYAPVLFVSGTLAFAESIQSTTVVCGFTRDVTGTYLLVEHSNAEQAETNETSQRSFPCGIRHGR